jgi:hypothetical protein
MAGARKILLPRLVVTKIANAGDPHVECISLPTTAPDEACYVCPLQTEDTDKRLDGKPRWQGTRFNLFPVVLDATGVPWAVAAGEIAASTAKRRMSAIIAFYTWLKNEGVLAPEHAPWKESSQKRLWLAQVPGSLQQCTILARRLTA